MKKTLVMMLVVCLAATLFAGCGTPGPVSSAPEAQASIAPAPDQSPADSVEDSPEPEPTEPSYFPLAETKSFTYWSPNSMALEQLGTSPQETEAMKYISGLMNIEIEFFSPSFTNAINDLNIRVASGEYPDAINGVTSYYTGGCSAAYNDGVIIALNDVVDQYMPNYKAALEAYDDLALVAYDDEGNMFSACGRSTDGFPATFGPIIRQDWLTELNMDSPETYDDYYNFLTAIKNEYGCSAPLMFNTDGALKNGTVDWNMLAGGYGVAATIHDRRGLQPFFAEEGVVNYGPLKDSFLEYLTTINKWYTEGLIYKDFMSMSADDGNANITNNQTGIWYWYSSRLDYYDGQVDDADYVCAAIQDAVTEKGNVNHLSATPQTMAFSNGPCISSTCGDVELIARYFDWGWSDEGYLFLNYGEKDVTYALADDGTVSYTDMMLHNENGWTLDHCQSMYCGTALGMVGMSDWATKNVSYNDAQLYAMELWSVHDNAWNMPEAMTMTVDEAARYGELYPDIRTCYEENFLAFLTGDKPLSEYDGFVEQLMQLGLEECISIKQASYDRYMNRGK